jgi:UDP-glucose 4-epimerase
MAAGDRFLVTGGAGFIGSHLCAELRSRGHRVRVLDDVSTGRLEQVPDGCEVVVGSVADRELCGEVCEGVDGVFHLAARIAPAPADDPGAYTRANIVGTQNLLLAAREASVRKLVYAGSSSYYGDQPPPWPDSLPPRCGSEYALSKYVGEQQCELFTRLYGLPTVSLRIFDVYGPGQPRFGLYALEPGLVLASDDDGEPFPVHDDGEKERDFIHVSDVVLALICAFDSAARGLALNVASGRSHPLKWIADAIAARRRRLARRADDVCVGLADISRTVELIGWRPQVAFEDGLAELIESLR